MTDFMEQHRTLLARRERQCLSGIPEVNLTTQPMQGNAPAELKKSNDNDLSKLLITANDSHKIYQIIGKPLMDMIEKGNSDQFNSGGGLNINKANELKKSYAAYDLTRQIDETLKKALESAGYRVQA